MVPAMVAAAIGARGDKENTKKKKGAGKMGADAERHQHSAAARECEPAVVWDFLCLGVCNNKVVGTSN